MAQKVRDAFMVQGRACEQLGSPFMARLMALIGERLTRENAVGARCLDWEGEPGPSGNSVPLRLAGALHGLILDGSAPPLAGVYPPNASTDDALWAEVERTIRVHETRILDWLGRAPQTNEVRRAAAIAAGIWWSLGEIGNRPLVLSELGASAGLNLSLDRFSVAIDGMAHGPEDAIVQLVPLLGLDRTSASALSREYVYAFRLFFLHGVLPRDFTSTLKTLSVSQRCNTSWDRRPKSSVVKTGGSSLGKYPLESNAFRIVSLGT